MSEKLKNIRVGVKLPAGFLLMAMLIVLVCMYFMFILYKIRTDNSHISDRLMPLTIEMENLKRCFSAVSHSTGILINRRLKDVSQRTLIYSQNLDHLASAGQSWSNIDHLSSGLSVQDQIQRLKTTWNSWKDSYLSISRIQQQKDRLLNSSASQDEIDSLDATSFSDFIQSNRFFSEISVMFTSLDSEISDELSGNFSRFSRSFRQNTFFLLFFCIFSISIAIYMGKRLSSEICIPIIRASKHLDLMADGDFSIPVSKHALERNDELGIIARSISGINNNIGSLLLKVQNNIQEMTALADKTSSASRKISDSAQQQSASFEELSSSIQLNATEISQANEIAQKTSENALRAGTGMQNTIEAMKIIDDSARKIAEATALITDIADQTNLLALNAAIEAARAGEHGRGFAVVADEVRKLAEKSATSAKEIVNLINESLKQVESGVQLSNSAGSSLTTIVENIENMARELLAISATTEEQAATMEENTAFIETNAISAEDLAMTADKLAHQAEELKILFSTFKSGTFS